MKKFLNNNKICGEIGKYEVIQVMVFFLQRSITVRTQAMKAQKFVIRS